MPCVYKTVDKNRLYQFAMKALERKKKKLNKLIF